MEASAAPPALETTMAPEAGPPGTQVHLRIVAIEASHQPLGDLVMWLVSSEGSACGGLAQRHRLGVVTWDGTIGIADFVVPDVRPSQYQVAELLGGGIACRLIGLITVTRPGTSGEPA